MSWEVVPTKHTQYMPSSYWRVTLILLWVSICSTASGKEWWGRWVDVNIDEKNLYSSNFLSWAREKSTLFPVPQQQPWGPEINVLNPWRVRQHLCNISQQLWTIRVSAHPRPWAHLSCPGHCCLDSLVWQRQGTAKKHLEDRQGFHCAESPLLGSPLAVCSCEAASPRKCVWLTDTLKVRLLGTVVIN